MEALSSEEGITDDASILEKAGVPVTVLPGKEQFFKVTTPGDWSRFTKMIEKEGLPFRIGQGYDIHRYDESRPLMLGGIEIAKTGGLLGHSDADVLLHAIMDALLGAAGLPDIGHYFPDTDPRYEGADSKKLMLEVARVLSEEGWQAGWKYRQHGHRGEAEACAAYCGNESIDRASSRDFRESGGCESHNKFSG